MMLDTQIAAASEEVLKTQQRLLESEIQANEDENRLLQADLDKIYAELDRRRK